jgi:hypothetical protein
MFERASITRMYPHRDGCWIINLGDMLERWTNGMYKSTLHRVVNTTGQVRTRCGVGCHDCVCVCVCTSSLYIEWSIPLGRYARVVALVAMNVCVCLCFVCVRVHSASSGQYHWAGTHALWRWLPWLCVCVNSLCVYWSIPLDRYVRDVTLIGCHDFVCVCVLVQFQQMVFDLHVDCASQVHSTLITPVSCTTLITRVACITCITSQLHAHHTSSVHHEHHTSGVLMCITPRSSHEWRASRASQVHSTLITQVLDYMWIVHHSATLHQTSATNLKIRTLHTCDQNLKIWTLHVWQKPKDNNTLRVTKT